MTATNPTLARKLGLKTLVCYGVGTMVGGGFYALLGKIAGEAGALTPLALAGSGLLALLNAFAFAELASRFPVSAGEARYVEEGLKRVWLSTATGVMVAITGVVSAAALATATAGFLRDLAPINHTLGVVLIVLALGGVAAWGIAQSALLVVLITIVEVAALLLVIAMNAGDVSLDISTWGERPESDPSGGVARVGGVGLVGVFSGAFLGFYAFIGFEDMVNIAEEVKRPRRNLPVAIFVSVVITTLLYVAVSVVAVSSMDIERLSESRTPIAELVGGTGLLGRNAVVLVSVLTGVNGALVQIIMSARVCYGLAGRGRLPAWMGRVSARTRTPLLTTAAVTAVILVLAIAVPLTQLAEATSAIILVVFALVNLSLWRLKGRDRDALGEGPRYPRWVPLLGFLSCVGVLAAQALLAVFG